MFMHTGQVFDQHLQTSATSAPVALTPCPQLSPKTTTGLILHSSCSLSSFFICFGLSELVAHAAPHAIDDL